MKNKQYHKVVSMQTNRSIVADSDSGAKNDDNVSNVVSTKNIANSIN